MFGSNVLEVTMGVVFVYLLVSLICSTINEQVITRFLALRAKTLEDGIKTMLNDPHGTGAARNFYDHPTIQGLSQPGIIDKMRGKDGKPSYISSRTFALTIQDMVADYKTAAKEIPPALNAILDQAKGDAGQELVNIEQWFNDTMDRVSGWYKRRVQLIIFALALVITVYLNIDTIALINNLSNSTVFRSALVSATQGTDRNILDSVNNLKQLQTNFQQIQPVSGWTTAPVTASDWISKIAGLLATTFAVSLGAPFWFDTLNKFMQFRSTGNLPPPPAPPS